MFISLNSVTGFLEIRCYSDQSCSLNFPTMLQDSEILNAVSDFVLKDIFQPPFSRLICASKGSGLSENFSRVRTVWSGKDELCDVPLVHGVTRRVQVLLHWQGPLHKVVMVRGTFVLCQPCN